MSVRVTTTMLDEVGDRDAPAGSREWAIWAIAHAERDRKDLDFNAKLLRMMLHNLETHKAWEPLGMSSFDAVCERLRLTREQADALMAGLGHEALGILIRRPEPRARRGQVPQIVAEPIAAPPTRDGSNPYAAAAAVFWPHHAPLLYRAFDQINARLYDGALPDIPIVVGLTPHGHALGRCSSGDPPMVTMHPSVLTPSSGNPWGIAAGELNRAFMVDVLTHELVHALLHLQGVPNTKTEPHHNDAAWCAELMRQSPLVGTGVVIASPWKRARVPGAGLTYTPTRPGSITREASSTWPHTLRPAGYYASDAPWFEREPFHTTRENGAS